MKILNKFLLPIILLLVLSSVAFSQGRFGTGQSLAISETETNYTITKDTVTIAGHLNVTTITFTTIVGTGTIDLTITNTTAGGDIGLNLQISQTTNALTGDLIGVRGNSRVNIDSPAGTAIGGKFQAGNMTAGYNMFVVKAIYGEIVNKIPSGNKTWEHARALELNMDLNQGSSSNVTTFDNAAAIYAVWNLPTAGSFTTVTNGYGIFMRNEQVGGNGQMLDAGFYLDDLNMGGGVKGWDFGVDFSGIEANFGTADFRLSDGALFNNSTADLLTITEATVDIDGNLTAGTITSDGAVSGTGATFTSLMLDLTQDYLFTDRSTSLVWQSQTNDAGANFELYTKKGDNGDNVIFTMWGTGLPADISNRERLIFGYIAANTQYEISTEADGTGTLRPLVLFTEGNTNQLVTETDGDVAMEAGDLILGVAGSSEKTPTFSIIHDADSDAPDTDETLAFSLTQNSDPTLSIHTVTNTNNLGIDFDMPLIASTLTSDGAIIGTTITGTGKISTIVTTKQFELGYDATNLFDITLLDDGHTTFTTVDPDGAEADINFVPDGNVGIKTAAPGTALEVTGVVTASGGFTDGTFTVDGSGNFTGVAAFTSTGAFTTPGIDDNADAIAITIDVTTEKVNFSAGIEVAGIVIRSVTAGITASNPGAQGDSPLTTDINEVSVVGAGSDAVTLPAAVAGLEIFIINNGANILEIFPASSDNLGAGVDTATTLASGANITFVAYDGTNWETK